VGDREVRTRTCGCTATARRRCGVCDPTRVVFTACSAACLRKHLDREHAVALDSAAQARESQQALNRDRQGRTLYAPHRDRLGRLLRAVQRGEGLCVLGAGNCDDLDLPGLVRDFGEVHLVDLDGDALTQALAGVSEPVRSGIVAHPDLDLSGTIDRVDAWGDDLPAQRELDALADEVSTRVARQVGRTFDVVLSACVLSQLYQPLRQTLLLKLEPWRRLFTAIERVHLATLAALTRPGGTGVLALDVTSSHKLPELRSFAAPETWDGLDAAATAAIATRKIELDPDPKRLMQLMAEPALAARIERPRLTTPWVWETGGGTLALVYGLMFTAAG
jgi:hypothetical protein